MERTYEKTRSIAAISCFVLALLFLLVASATISYISPPRENVTLFVSVTAVCITGGLLFLRLLYSYVVAAAVAMSDHQPMDVTVWFKRSIRTNGLKALLVLPCIVAGYFLLEQGIGFVLIPLALVLYAIFGDTSTVSTLFQSREKLNKPQLLAKLNRFLQAAGVSADELWVLKSGSVPLRPTAYMWQEGGGAVAAELLGEPKLNRPKVVRVLFTDTLLNELTDDETCAVCLHELAHQHHDHLTKQNLFTLLFGGLLIAGGLALAYFGGSHLLGLSRGAIELLPIGVAGVLCGWTAAAIASKMLSRLHEYQADQYAVHHSADASPVVTALQKSCKLAGMDIDEYWLYTFLFCEHPSVANRIARAQSVRSTSTPV